MKRVIISFVFLMCISSLFISCANPQKLSSKKPIVNAIFLGFYSLFSGELVKVYINNELVYSGKRVTDISTNYAGDVSLGVPPKRFILKICIPRKHISQVYQVDLDKGRALRVWYLNGALSFGQSNKVIELE